VDISSLLANITVATVTSESSTFLSGDRLAMLSASAGWLPQNLFTQQGVYIQQTILANGRTVRDEMGLIADSEGGFFYADRLGRLVYVDRNGASTNSRWNTVQAELLAECPPDDGSLPLVDVIPTRSGAPIVHLQSFVTDWSRDRVVNDIQLANQGGSAFQVVDQTSQSKYGPRTYQRLDFLNDNTHPEYLLERSQDFMDGYTDAVMRVNSVTFRPSKADPNLYYFTLMAFLNDLVRVRYTHPTEGWGYSLVSHVQSVEHTITPSDWECKFELDQIEAFNRWDGAMGGTGWDDAIWDEGRWDGKQTGQWNRTAKWSDGISVWK
jgi:hypothetical protein